MAPTPDTVTGSNYYPLLIVMETVKNGKGDWKRPIDPHKWEKDFDAIKWKSKRKSKAKSLK